MKKSRRLLSLVLAMLMAISVFSGISFTAYASSGKCGNNATWYFDDYSKTLTISGSGIVESPYLYGETTFYELKPVNIVVNDGITELGKYCLQSLDVLQTVSLPNTLTKIGENAFHMSTLRSFTAPSSLKVIDHYAFWDCEQLETVVLNEGLEEIGADAFDCCLSLTSINIPSTVKYIEGSAFSLTNISFLELQPSVLQTKSVLNNCYNLLSVNFNTSDAIIDDFTHCTNLHSVCIGNKIQEIYFDAFTGCKNLTTIVMSNNVKTLGKNAFANCNNLSTIYYVGTEDDFNSIKGINTGGLEGNECFLKANVVYLNENFDPFWFHDGYGWRFCDKDLMCIHDTWREINGEWYYFDSNGYMAVNTWAMDSQGWCYLDENGHITTNKWKSDSQGWLFLDETGHIATNMWIADSQGWLYLDENGRPVTNKWQMDNTGWCYLDSNGYMVYSVWQEDYLGWLFIDDTGHIATDRWMADSWGWLYLGEDGRMVKDAWVKDYWGWCYLDSNGYMTCNKWIMDSQGWCYVNSSGHMLTNAWAQDSQGWCYLDETGHFATNRWVRDSYGWCYVDENGRMVKNAWVMNSDDWCYLDSNGYLTTNTWICDSYDWLYLGEDGRPLKEAWTYDSQGWCYMDYNGYITRGSSFEHNGEWYFCDYTGHMVTGWYYMQSQDAWHYYHANGVEARNGWLTIDGTDYYFDKNGKMSDPPKDIDINYYVQYAKEYAAKIGLEVDEAMTNKEEGCWDNPISAHEGVSDEVIKRDIESRLDRYKNIEHFTAVGVFAEEVEQYSYEIYILYA